MVKILFSEVPKKRLRRELKPPTLGRQEWLDTEQIRQILSSKIDPADTLRVRLVRKEPFPAYRITILRKYKHIHIIKCKDGRTAQLKPGLYVEQSYFVESFTDGLVWNPPLREENEHEQTSEEN